MCPISRHLSLRSLALFLAASFPAVLAVDNGLARTPQLGWNNWNSLGCDVSESLLLDTSSILVSSGLRDVGYNYVVLDDCWSDGRGADGYIKVDQKKFPNGMKHVAKALHDQNLLFGMYSSAGEFTCARYEGSLDHEEYDAKSWASWDVDYLKYDNCYHRGRFGYPEISFNRYNVMAQALNATGRQILYSLCSWGEDYVHTWGSAISNSWRMSGDIYDSFSRPDDLCACTNAADPHCQAPGTHCSVLYIINKVATFCDRGAPGGWNDMDMLEVGNGGMTDAEYIVHFSMWAALKSPLLIGADLRELVDNPSTLTILNNPAVLAVSQDPVGRSVSRILRKTDGVPKDRYGVGEVHIWTGPLSGGDQLLIFLNAGDAEVDMSASLIDIFVFEGPEGSAPQSKLSWRIHDLWAHRMDDNTAKRILEAKDESSRATVFREAGWYNSTETSYKEGLEKGDERLFGGFVGTVQPGGEVRATVERHGLKMFRLRSEGGATKRYALTKDEL